MSGRPWLLAALAALSVGAPAALAGPAVVIIEGLGGNERYRSEFAEQVDVIAAAARTLSPQPEIKVFRAGAERDAILEHFDTLSANVADQDPLTVYLIGHGSYDDHEYKFNIAGPDLTDADILGALNAVDTRNQILVNTSSSSGAGSEMWQSDERIVITATRSGAERHATRFGIRFAAALASDAADLDKNEIITAQEAFEFADRGVRDFFEQNGNLATEHAEIAGDRASRFTLARLTTARTQSGDRQLEELRASRDSINGVIEDLRLKRDSLSADAYQSELLSVMLELAEIEEAIERREAELETQ